MTLQEELWKDKQCDDKEKQDNKDMKSILLEEDDEE